MRIISWGSDVCPPELLPPDPRPRPRGGAGARSGTASGADPTCGSTPTGSTVITVSESSSWLSPRLLLVSMTLALLAAVGTYVVLDGGDDEPPDRKRVVEGKSVSVRVDLGGRRNIKKKQKTQRQRKH